MTKQRLKTDALEQRVLTLELELGKLKDIETQVEELKSALNSLQTPAKPTQKKTNVKRLKQEAKSGE